MPKVQAPPDLAGRAFAHATAMAPASWWSDVWLDVVRVGRLAALGGGLAAAVLLVVASQTPTAPVDAVPNAHDPDAAWVASVLPFDPSGLDGRGR